MWCQPDEKWPHCLSVLSQIPRQSDPSLTSLGHHGHPQFLRSLWLLGTATQGSRGSKEPHDDGGRGCSLGWHYSIKILWTPWMRPFSFLGFHNSNFRPSISQVSYAALGHKSFARDQERFHNYFSLSLMINGVKTVGLRNEPWSWTRPGSSCSSAIHSWPS